MDSKIIRTIKTQRKNLINDILNYDLYGRKIYLLGSAEYGATNEPILIKSSIKLYNTFGTKGSLIKAFHAIKYTNTNNELYLVKTTGEHGTCSLNVNIENGAIIENGFILSSSESNEIFNDIEIIVDIDSIQFIFPRKLGRSSIKYNYKDYPTIERLTNAINKDTKNKHSYIYAYYTVDDYTKTENAFFCCNPTLNYINGANSGLNYSKNLLYNCLSVTYEILESHDIDIIIPVDAFIDDIYPDDEEDELYSYNMKYYHAYKDYLTKNIAGTPLSYLNQLINFCLKQLNFGIVTTGVMGYNSYYRETSKYLYESDYLTKMYKACLEYNLKCCLNPFYSFLVSVVAGDIKYNRGTIIDNGYLAYSALCANTIITSGTTNIPISDRISIYQEFTEPALKALSEDGIVTFRHSPLYNTPVIYSGITLSKDENLSLYCNIRMIQLCISYLNKLYQYYIGLDMIWLIDDNIVREDTDTILYYLKQRNIITNYSFSIEPIYIENKINVYLSLRTNYMIKNVILCAVINAKYNGDVILDEWHRRRDI